MYQTIQLSSCVSVQGEFVEALGDGRVAIRDGETVYRGQPVAPRRSVRTPAAAMAEAGKPDLHAG